MHTIEKSESLARRHRRVRQRVVGTAVRPRLNVYRSRGQIYAQIIDDANGCTMVSASSLEPAIRTSVKNGGNVTAAIAVGRLLAERAKTAKVTAVVFDRGGRLYHGRIKALAEASRAGGLQF
jgi:large subunit ribosomal protein L18